MVTTFARLAKVIKGYIKPANWIERAFATIGEAIMPSYTLEDEGKVLGVTKVEDGYDETVIVQEQTLTLNGSKKAALETDSYDFSSLSNGDKVIVLVTSNGETTEIECTYRIADISAEGVFTVTCGSRPTITYTAGTANATYTFKAVTREAKYKAEPAWVEGGSGGSYFNAVVDRVNNTVTAEKTWQEIYDSKYIAIAIENPDGIFRSIASIMAIYFDGENYCVDVLEPSADGQTVGEFTILTFQCTSDDSYPVAVIGGD